ncbi:MAG: hypothetical protein HZB29_10290 [Nitrospinae bacterium]|nr:hypothetical protein [Nitrospinota bacterium]
MAAEQMEEEIGKRHSYIPLFAASVILLAIIAAAMFYSGMHAYDMPAENLRLTNLLHERTRACTNPSLAGRCKEIEKEIEALKNKIRREHQAAPAGK